MIIMPGKSVFLTDLAYDTVKAWQKKKRWSFSSTVSYLIVKGNKYLQEQIGDKDIDRLEAAIEK